MKKTEIKSKKTDLDGLVNHILTEINKMSKKPLTEDDLKNAKIEISEMDVTEIIHQDEITISSPGGTLKVPVYLDKYNSWFFKRESIKPLISLPEAVNLKVCKDLSAPGRKKLIACYPLELCITEIVARANQLLQSDVQISSGETKKREVQ